MFSHMMVGSNDLDRSKAFYDKLLGALGLRPGLVDPKGRVVYPTREGSFLITKPLDGEPASPGNGMTIGFKCNSPEQVDAWHKTGIEAGGEPIEDPPGVREGGGLRLYLAYLRDPDGNKICGMHRMS